MKIFEQITVMRHTYCKHLIKIVLLISLFIPNLVTAQSVEEEIEFLFAGKSLHQFEIDLAYKELTNQPAMEFLESEYNLFFLDIKARLQAGEQIDQILFQTEYNTLIQRLKNDLKVYKQFNKPTTDDPEKILNGPCVNMDFEEGTFNGWTLTRGNVPGTAPYSFNAPVGIAPGTYHTIYTNGMDGIVPIPRVSPFNGSTRSVRLGNGTGTGARAARMTQTFLVDASNYLFVYDYAVVFQSPAGHTLNEQPYFTVRVFDQNGVSIPCGEYSVIADAANAADYSSTVSGGEIILYKNWSQVITNLITYIGQNVTIEFTAGDCSLSGHYGYAYVDASCGTEEIYATDTIICQGTTATLTAPGGVGSYLWTTGETTQSIVVNAAGTYGCTLTPFQGSGCAVYLEKTVTIVPALTVTAAPETSYICFGEPFQTVTATPSGGTPPYSYSWSSGQTTQSANIVDGGTYTVTLTDAGNCLPVQDQVTIIEFTQPITANAGPNLTVCAGNSTAIAVNGSVTGVTTGTWTGGSGTYSANPNDLTLNYTMSAAEVAAGSATLTLTTTNNGDCPPASDVMTITISELNVTLTSQQNVSCFGGSNGNAIINATGGLVPFSYSIDGGPGQASNTFNGLPAGSHTVVVTDAAGCSGSVTFNITSPAQLTFSQVSQNVSCFNACNGQITVTANGGTTPYSYSSNFGTTFYPSNVLSNLCAGTVGVVVQDANGCLTNANVNITQPTQLTANYVLANPVCAGACDGSVTVNASGGTPAYQYAVDGGAFQPGNVLSSLCDGDHDIIVQDANGCQITSEQILVDPPTFGIDLVSMTASNCGFNNGSIEVIANGANGPFTYSMDGGPSQPTGVYTNLVADAYSFVATDALGCQAQVFQGINDIEMDGILLDQGDALCYGGSEGFAEVINVSGAPPITYELDNSGITQTNGLFTGLFAGSHIITIYDAGLCVFTIPFMVNEPDEIDFDVVATDVTCNAGDDGEINFTSTTGGTGAYQYSIDGFTFQTGTSFTGLTAGTYFLYVMDDNGCMVFDEITIDEPTVVTFNFNSTNLTCFQNNTGLIQLDGFGGTGNYTYSINNGTTTQANQTFFGLSAGNYPILVEDGSGCPATGNIILTEPAPLVANYLTTPVSCFGVCDGEIQIGPNGGTGPYFYSSDGGQTLVNTSLLDELCAGSYQVQVIDDNGCGILSNVVITSPTLLTVNTAVVPSTCGLANGEISGTAAGGSGGYLYSIDNITFGGTSTYTGLSPNLYTIYVVDANGCEAQADGIIDDLTSPVITGSSFENVTCNADCDGEIQISSTGGTGTILYSIGGAYQPSSIFQNLCDGIYTISVIDDNGCETFGPQDIEILQPDPLAFVVDFENVLCNSIPTGSIEINASGGTQPYDYSFNGGTNYQTDNFQSFLPAGQYDLEVVDLNNCTFTQQVNITEPPMIDIVNIATTDATCFDGCNGTAFATAQGGTIATGYQFYWDTLNLPLSDDAAAGLCFGTYLLTVVDDNGCWDSLSFNIGQPVPFVIDTVIAVDPLCFGSCDGQLTVNSPAATAYSFDGGLTFGPSNVATGLCQGTYDIVTQNVDGCTDTLIGVILTDPALLGVVAGNDSIICLGTDGLLYANAHGGVQPYTYNWDDGSIGQTITVSPVVNTTYTVTVEDDNGCVSVGDAMTINIYDVLTTTESNDTTICPGIPVPLTVNVNSGQPGYSYSWTQAGTVFGTNSTVVVAPNVTTTYIVATTDFCTTVEDTVLVSVFGIPNVGIGVEANEGCAPMTAVLYSEVDPNLLGTSCTWTFSNGTTVNGCDTVTSLFTEPGCYDVTLNGLTSDGCAFTSFGSDVFCVVGNPVADFYYTPFHPTFLEPEVNFTNESIFAENYYWTFSPGYGNSTAVNPTVNFANSDAGDVVTACLIASNYLGCADTVCYNIIIEDAYAIYVPNTFTPDGDKYNSIFRPVFPVGYDVQNYEMQIYDRWGEMIFKSNEVTEGWDGYYMGDLMQTGTYTWKIVAMDGTTRKKYEYVGHCNLLK